jgi:putative ABC transport system permease protein
MKRLFRLPLSRDRVKRDVDEELTFHLEGRIEELMAGGMSRPAAEHEAMRRFGDRARVEAEVERIDVTTVERRALRDRLDATWRDARYAWRGLARRPLYALAVVLTLALAIGANTAIFSLVEAVLLRPVDVPAIGRLAVVKDDFPLMGLRNASISPAEAIDLFARKDLFTTAAGVNFEASDIDVRGEPARVRGSPTMGEFFDVFGLHALYGRLYRPEDSQVGRAPVVVLSYRLWQQLSGDIAIIGRTLNLNDRPYEVIGVLPPDAGFPKTSLYWRPLVLDSTWLGGLYSRGTLATLFVGRMRAGVTLDGLTRELRALALRWHEMYPSGYANGGHTMLAMSFVEVQAGALKPIVLALFSAVVFVLLIACANVASLQLVRSAGRARELAVRAALGAGRAAIARQLVVESALLALVGGAAGAVLGRIGLAWLTSLNLARFPVLRGLKLDGMVLAFTGGTVLLAGLAFGTAPAIRAARADVSDALRDSGRGSSASAGRHRFLRASVIVQNALTLLLLVGAALTIRSLSRLMQTDPGFQPDHVVTFSLSLVQPRYDARDQRLAFLRSLADRLKALPGTQAVAFANGVPFTDGAGSTPYALTGVASQPGEPERHANMVWVYGDYFRTLGIQIVRGRDFTEEDFTSGNHTVLVDETLVRQSFGKADPIGAQIEHGPKGTIIGVARVVKLGDLAEGVHPTVYHAANAGIQRGVVTVVRSSLPPDQAIRAMRAVVADLDPKVVFSDPKPLAERVSDSLGARRLARDVLAGFATLSLLLALLGVYAVMSYVVNQRTREIGIRVALGAQRLEIAAMVMRDGVVLAAAGLAIGAAAFLGFGRLVQAMLYGVGILDPLALGAAVLLLGAITLAACWLPARRAVRVDPVVALRAE